MLCLVQINELEKLFFICLYLQYGQIVFEEDKYQNKQARHLILKFIGEAF